MQRHDICKYVVIFLACAAKTYKSERRRGEMTRDPMVKVNRLYFLVNHF